MGRTFDADEIYFDELAVGISSGIKQNNGNNYNSAFNNLISIVFDLSLATQVYVNNEVLDFTFLCDIELIEDYSKYVDLMQLVPSKFHDSVVLQQFLDTAGLETGSWLGSINDLVANLDPYSVGENEMQYLADLIGLTLVGDDNTLIADKRRQLVQAVDWYKMKCTYRALKYIAYLINLKANIWDMYTNDYVHFVDKDWFVGDVGENPPGLDSSYYKSPHLGAEIFLDTAYGAESSSYLFLGTEFDSFIPYVEKIRPVNVVVDYRIFLNPVTNETGAVVTMDGNIHTCVIGVWSLYRLYFDDIGSTTTGAETFDNSLLFDFSATAFLHAITTWKLGTGNKNVLPHNTSFTLQHVALTGTINSITEVPEYVDYEILVPNTITQSGISELGLYFGSTLEIASTFPDINLVLGVTLRIVVRLYK
jgi:hypothetical protein